MSYDEQAIRQATLVRGGALDVSQVSERLALFDEVTGQPYPFVGEDWIVIPDDQMSVDWHRHSDSYPPQYRKRPNGQVELRGVVSPGDWGTIFTLPEGYGQKSGGDLHFPVTCSTAETASIAISGLGAVILAFYPGQDLHDVEWMSLAPISYSID